MRDGPRILASFVQGTLSEIEARSPLYAERIRERLGPDTLERIESSVAVAWLPVECDVELTEAYFAVAGQEMACSVMRANLRDSLEKPFLRPMLDGAISIFGLTPEKILRWASKLWMLIYRDCGRLTLVDPEPRRVQLHLEELPPCIAESRSYLDGMASAMMGFFDVTRLDGQVSLEEYAPERGRAVFTFTWSPEA